MLNPAALEARARLEAHRRVAADPTADLDALTLQITTEMYAAEEDSDIDALVDSAPKMTPAQLARIKGLAMADSRAAVA
jgi:hypothetical protein